MIAARNFSAADPQLTPSAHAEVVRRLREMVTWLAEPETAQVDSADTRNQRLLLLRLSGTVLALAIRHRPDEDGRCRSCHPAPRGWRRFIPHRRSPIPCTVHLAVELFLNRDTDVVWWLALGMIGRHDTLADVRAWLARGRRQPEPGDADEQNLNRHKHNRRRPRSCVAE